MSHPDPKIPPPVHPITPSPVHFPEINHTIPAPMHRMAQLIPT